MILFLQRLLSRSKLYEGTVIRIDCDSFVDFQVIQEVPLLHPGSLSRETEPADQHRKGLTLPSSCAFSGDDVTESF